MMRWVLACTTLAFAACASAPPPAALPEAPLPLRDDAFAPASQPVSARSVFALSDAMRSFLSSTSAAGLHEGGDTRRQLVDLLYRRQKLAIEYDSSVTRTAAETFAARAGNCLSLVIMTASFAKALDVPVRFQRVFVEDSWSRSGDDLYFASSHVNLALDWAPVAGRFSHDRQPTLVVDFLPGEDLRGRRTQELSEGTIVAMYLNNRAAEALARGALDDAYWWAREAVLQDPAFGAGRNTLGVVYLRRGLAADAGRVLEGLLAREPANVNALVNLAQALRQQGREPEAQALDLRLAQLETTPPFHWFNAGLQAMRERDYEAARDLFRRELRRDGTYHEFHFWLAQAELALGHPAAAQRHLEKALQESTSARQHEIYSAKLDRLRAATRTQ